MSTLSGPETRRNPPRKADLQPFCANLLPIGCPLRYSRLVSKKSAKIAALIEDCRGQGLDAHYLGYFACFNRGLYYEAHDVLEELWLAERHGPNYSFYKGLIQLAGAFVHLQKGRMRPAAALFKLARPNLSKKPMLHEQLEIAGALRLIDEWLRELESSQFVVNPLTVTNVPKLLLSGRE